MTTFCLKLFHDLLCHFLRQILYDNLYYRPLESALAEKMNHVSVFSKPRADQSDSPLFSTLPGEVRDRIFEYTLHSYEDTSHLYDLEAAHRRPGYLAPLKSDRAVLQTCQQAYAEAWFRPWASATHTFWLGKFSACQKIDSRFSRRSSYTVGGHKHGHR